MINYNFFRHSIEQKLELAIGLAFSNYLVGKKGKDGLVNDQFAKELKFLMKTYRDALSIIDQLEKDETAS